MGSKIDRSIGSVDSGRWYCVELHWMRHVSEGLVEMYVDGAKVLELTGLNTDSYGNADTLRFGICPASNVQNSLTIHGDCTAASNTYIGPEVE